MKYVSPVFVALAVVAFASTPAHSQAPVQLAWKFQPGKKLNVSMVQDMRIEMNVLGRNNVATTVNQSWMTWEAKEVKDDIAVIDSTITRMKIDVESAIGKQSVDTDVAEGTPGQDATMGKMIRGLVDVPMKQTMQTNGKIVSMEVPAKVKQLMGATGSDMIESLSRNGSLEFPAGPLAIGKSWQVKFESPSPVGTMKMNNTYTYKGTAEKSGKTLHAFEVDIKMDFAKGEGPVQITIDKQSTKGMLYFDADLGHLSESSVDQDVDMIIETQGQKLNQNLKSKSSITFTEG